MKDKFRESFEVIRGDVLRANYGSNPWQEKNQVITSVSWVSRIEDANESLLRSQWDLIIVDEAHKMSAASADKKTLAYELGEAHFNRFGALHGGAIACVMDDVLAVAAGFIAKWGEIAPTLEMKVSYLSQGSPGRHIAEARVIKRGRQINFLEATLANESGKLIATSTATIMIAANDDLWKAMPSITPMMSASFLLDAVMSSIVRASVP